MVRVIRRRDFLAALPFAGAAQTVRRNVLFIVADDMNTALGCYGDPNVRSPNLDGLARRGVLFRHAYCQYPLCQPSRTSFLSGRRPQTTRVWTLQTPTRQYLKGTVFLPESYRHQAYYTPHAGTTSPTADHAENPRPWDQEFREYAKPPPASAI